MFGFSAGGKEAGTLGRHGNLVRCWLDSTDTNAEQFTAPPVEWLLEGSD